MLNKTVSNSHFPSFFCISCLLLDHYNESIDKSFVCALCLRRYSKLSCLKRHVRYECTKNPNRMSFKCPYCNHMSKRRDSLTQHILSLHQSRKSHQLVLNAVSEKLCTEKLSRKWKNYQIVSKSNHSLSPLIIIIFEFSIFDFVVFVAKLFLFPNFLLLLNKTKIPTTQLNLDEQNDLTTCFTLIA